MPYAVPKTSDLAMAPSVKVSTAAEILECDESTIRRMLRRGDLTGHRAESAAQGTRVPPEAPPATRGFAAATLATILALLAAPAHAEPPDIADLVGVHQEMRRAATIPEYDWPLRDGVWDCEDNARWARALLEARGWPRERLGIYLGLDVWGRPHAVLCASGEGLDEPICLDRVWSSVVPLSAYGDGWREVDLP